MSNCYGRGRIQSSVGALGKAPPFVTMDFNNLLRMTMYYYAPIYFSVQCRQQNEEFKESESIYVSGKDVVSYNYLINFLYMIAKGLIFVVLLHLELVTYFNTVIKMCYFVCILW